MWDVLNKRPRGRLSQRTLHVLATGLIVAVLLCLSVFTHSSYADTNTAVMKDSILQYNGDNYTQQPDLGANDPRNFSAGTHNFSYTPSGGTKVDYIFIDSSVAVDQATIGAFVTYTYAAPNTYTDQSAPVQLTITHAAGDPTVKTSTTSCSSDGFASLGWILCPVTTGISNAVDGIYHIITQFFDAPPLTSDSAIYKIWDTVRSIANIMFVIAFLIIIYSQITSMGISKYGIRTILPRLIVAAVLVNVSYWVCSLGIDLSNFLGHSVESFFASYLTTLQGSTVVPDWSSITQVLIAGGTGGVALIGGVGFMIANAGSLAAILYILLGMVVSVILAVLVALIILAARQAILIVFTILSPLAFVAMILPSTEKLFNKWKDVMLSMLVMFPLFGLIYGGSQVAGAAIILGSKGNLIILLLGKFVTFIPLAITPLLIKFSSGILGTIASAVDGRRKGIADRFNKWNNEQIDFSRKRSLGKNFRGNLFRAGAQSMDGRKRRQEQILQGAEARSAARAQSTRRYRKAYNYAQESTLAKETTDNNLKAQWDDRRQNVASVIRTDITARNAERSAKLEADKLDAMHAGIAAEGGSTEALTRIRGSQKNLRAIRSSADNIRTLTEEIAATGMAKVMAERKEKESFAQHLRDSADGKVVHRVDGKLIHEYAGGIMKTEGVNSAISQAKATASKYLMDDIKNIQDTMDYKESTNVKILHQKFTGANTLAERVAYANAIAKNGGPGINELRQVITEYEQTPGLSQEELFGFKELLGTNSSVMSAGKDIEFWITNSKRSDANGDYVLNPDGTPAIRTFDDLSNDVGTWKALSASAFAHMNIVSQFHALKVMQSAGDGSYDQYINMLRQSTVKEDLKSAVRAAHNI